MGQADFDGPVGISARNEPNASVASVPPRK